MKMISIAVLVLVGINGIASAGNVRDILSQNPDGTPMQTSLSDISVPFVTPVPYTPATDPARVHLAACVMVCRAVAGAGQSDIVCSMADSQPTACPQISGCALKYICD